MSSNEPIAELKLQKEGADGSSSDIIVAIHQPECIGEFGDYTCRVMFSGLAHVVEEVPVRGVGSLHSLWLAMLLVRLILINESKRGSRFSLDGGIVDISKILSVEPDSEP